MNDQPAVAGGVGDALDGPQDHVALDAHVAGEGRDDGDAQRFQVVGGDAAPVEHEAFDVRAAGAAGAVGARQLEAGAHAVRQRRAVGAADDRRAPVAEQRHLPIDARPAVAPGCDVDDVARARRVDRGLDRRVTGGDTSHVRRRRLRQRREHRHRCRPCHCQPAHRRSRHSGHGRRLPIGSVLTHLCRPRRAIIGKLRICHGRRKSRRP